MSDDVVYSEAVYGKVTRQPLVKITFGFEVTLLTAENTREVALDLILTSMAAEADAFLIEFLQEKLDMPINQIMPILGDFRAWRAKRGQVDERPE